MFFQKMHLYAPGDVYVICHPGTDDFIDNECDEYHTYLSNGDDGFCLVEGTESSFNIIDCIGTWVHRSREWMGCGRCH